MARGTRSRKLLPSPKRVQKTRAQKVNTKPKTSPRQTRNSQKATIVINVPSITPVKKEPTKSKKNTPQLPQKSPSVFSSNVVEMYRCLGFAENTNHDLVKNTSDADVSHKQHESSDLFPTEPSEQVQETPPTKTPVQMISVSVQCSPVRAQDVGVGPDEVRFRDFGVQTDPIFDTSHTFVSESDESSGDCDSCSTLSDLSDCYSRGSGSSDPLRDFEMFDDVSDNDEKIYTKDENQDTDETKSAVSGSPIRDGIYVNDKFHSPNSLRICLKMSVNNNNKGPKNQPISKK